MLEAVQHALRDTDTENSDITLDDILNNIELDVDRYINALKVSPQGPTIILKWSPCDTYINPCDLDILHLWGGNVDLQHVTDEIATVMYVCCYMTKGKKAMGETLKRVAQECRNDDVLTQMKKIINEFLGKCVLASPESAMHVMSMWLMKKSRKVQNINTNMQDECVSLPKTRVQLAQMEDDDDNVFGTSLIDRYVARPNELENMCFATFAVTYDVATSSLSLEQNEDINIDMDNLNNDNSENPKIIMLKDGLGQMRKRKQESILRTK